MFVENVQGIEKTILVDSVISDYLQEQGIPLLSFQDGKCVFKDTFIVRHTLKNLPIGLRLRFLLKGGGKI